MRQRIFLWMIVLAVAIIFSAASVYAGTVSLPKTGQTTCYDSAGATVDCATTGAGQDGDTLAGVDWPIPRFTNEDGTTPLVNDCVTDQLTGLMWTRDTNLKPNVNWQSALNFANGLILCGYSDWRLPNVNELESLINYGIANPVAYLRDPDGGGTDSGFLNVQPGYYWTSTTYFGYIPPKGEYSAIYAWAASIRRAGTLYGGFYGNVKNLGVPTKTMVDADFPSGSLHVWPVRGGVQD